MKTIIPKDSQLTFYLNVYQDVALLNECLKQLRQVYPTSRLIIRSDGDDDPAIANVAIKYGGSCYYSQRLMALAKGGQIVHEMLRLFLLQETDYLFKIDPDTCVARKFHALPDVACIFGRKQGCWTGEPVTLDSIQGGCIGVTLDVAKKFYTSNFFLDPALGHCPPPWVIAPPLRRRPIELGLTSIDWTIGWACKEMGIEVLDWAEIKSEWQIPPQNDDLQYAVTHPHKLLPWEDHKRLNHS
ncbi:MAG: hypothetical protein H6668_23400 [Ardenticatenaceae bacterium]|nr:hypothetical protein [Ardenticatenaceae bacterium]